ncbi:Protein NDR1, partial [Linum perenne]
NPNLNKGIYYDPIKVSFFHISNRSDSLGNFTISRFYQGHKKKATKDGTIGNATEAILRGGTAAGFRVEIAIRVRYKLIFFKTKRRQIVVEADFEFNGKGIERGGGRRERRLNEEEVGGKGD